MRILIIIFTIILGLQQQSYSDCKFAVLNEVELDHKDEKGELILTEVSQLNIGEYKSKSQAELVAVRVHMGGETFVEKRCD